MPAVTAPPINIARPDAIVNVLIAAFACGAVSRGHESRVSRTGAGAAHNELLPFADVSPSIAKSRILESRRQPSENPTLT